MKKDLLILSLVCFGLTLGIIYLYSPDVGVYGQTVVQFDEKRGTHFVEITYRQDIEPGGEIAVGMPVSYMQTSGTVLYVSSKVQSLEEMIEERKKNARLGCLAGGIVCWCVGAFYLWRCHKASTY